MLAADVSTRGMFQKTWVREKDGLICINRKGMDFMEYIHTHFEQSFDELIYDLVGEPMLWSVRTWIPYADAISAYGKKHAIIDKETFGSLYLGEVLKPEYLLEQKSMEIHFCGVCTRICVISNVLIAKAAMPEAKVCVIEDACACVTPESHKTAIEAMKTCQVDII